MKRNTLKLTSIVLIVLWIWGCAHVPNYGLNDVQQMAAPKFNMKIAVTFVGDRPKGSMRVSKPDLAKMVALHVKKANLFPDAEAVEEKFGDLSREHMAELKAMGYGAVLIGKIQIFRGEERQTGTAVTLRLIGAGLCVALPPIGLTLLIISSMMKSDQSGEVLLDVKIKKTEDGALIWEGYPEGAFFQRKAGKVSEAADAALEKAAESMIDQIAMKTVE